MIPGTSLKTRFFAVITHIGCAIWFCVARCAVFRLALFAFFFCWASPSLSTALSSIARSPAFALLLLCRKLTPNRWRSSRQGVAICHCSTFRTEQYSMACRHRSPTRPPPLPPIFVSSVIPRGMEGRTGCFHPGRKPHVPRMLHAASLHQDRLRDGQFCADGGS